MGVDRLEERIMAERPEAKRERLEVVLGQRLIRKRQHLVLEPRHSDLGHGRIIQVA